MRRKRFHLIVAAGFIAAGMWVPQPVGAGPSGGALPPQLVLAVYVADGDLVPYDALAVALNVTVADPAGEGFLTVYPCDEDEPNTSNLNYRAGITVPNAVISRVDPDGYVCIATSAATDVIVDVEGYFPFDSPLTPLGNPERILDTRNSIGAPPTRLLAGSTLEFQVGGRLSTPADASAAVMNVTAVNAGAAGFATVYPCGQPVPNASNLNFANGQTVPALVIARLGSAGKVCVKTTATIDVLADVSGYFPADTVGYTAIGNPERVLDTRNGIGAPTGVTRANTELGFQLVGKAGIPASATAVVLNVTATQASGAGFTTVFACGTALPNASNLNFRGGADVPNLVIAKVGADGRVCARSSADVGLIADVAGYFEGVDAYVPLASPNRAADTRQDGELRCNLAISRMTNHSVTVTDLKTGAQRTVSNPLMDETPINRSALLSDCSGFISLVRTVPVGASDVVEFKFNGQATVLFHTSGLPSLGVVDDGTAMIFNGGGLTDVRTGMPLVSLFGGIPANNSNLPPGLTYLLSGFTGDGIAAFLAIENANQSVRFMTYWDVATGEYLGEGPAPDVQGISAVPGISKYGSYLSMLIATPEGSRLSIQTPDGVPILVSPFIIVPPPSTDNYARWIGDGSMLICQADHGNPGVYRWDIFSAPTLLFRGPCPAAAG